MLTYIIEEQKAEHKIREEQVWMKLSDILPEVLLFSIFKFEIYEKRTSPDSVRGIAYEMVRILRKAPMLAEKMFKRIAYDHQYEAESLGNLYYSRIFIRWFDDEKYPEIKELLSEDVYKRIKKEDISMYNIITRLDNKYYIVFAVFVDGKLKPFRVVAKNMCPYPIHIDSEPIEGQMTLSVVYD
jgi:hypothetical protein